MSVRILSHFVLLLLWLLHFLPLPVLAICGKSLGFMFYFVGMRRRKIVLVNLTLCFPNLAEKERTSLARAHFKMLGRSFLERSKLWWASEDELRRLIHVSGENHIKEALNAGKAVILLAPHFVGLDAGGIGIALRFDAMSMYSTQKNAVFDALILRGRKRFNAQLLLSRQDGILKTIKAMKKGLPFYYLPDMDLGREDALFAPFFGVKAATITGLPRLAKVANAVIITCVTRILENGKGYEVTLEKAWENFPTEDVFKDTCRMNDFIEHAVKTMPEQYYWVHRRFKTRPQGEEKFY